MTFFRTPKVFCFLSSLIFPIFPVNSPKKGSNEFYRNDNKIGSITISELGTFVGEGMTINKVKNNSVAIESTNMKLVVCFAIIKEKQLKRNNMN